MEYSGELESVMTPEKLEYHALKVAYSMRSPRRRTLTRFVEVGTGGKKMVFHNSVNNLHAAIMGRVFYVKGDDGVLREPPKPRDLSHLKKFLKRLAEKINYGGKMSYTDFVELRSGPKKASYLRELETLSTRITCWRDEVAKYFIKDELMELKPKGDGTWEVKTPRCIRPQSVRLNLLLGVHIAPLEKAVYRGLDRYLSGNSNVRRVVTKAMNVYEIGDLLAKKWAAVPDPICVQLDCSRFSQHVHVDTMDVMRDFLVKVTGENTHEGRDLKEQLNRQRVVKFVASAADGVISGKVTGTLSDGVMNTSLYGVTIMCAMVHDACARAGIGREIFSAGDDTSIICSRKDWALIVPHLKEVGLDYGFTIKTESTADALENIVFCRMSPVFDGTAWRMVREPKDSMIRDAMTAKSIPNEAVWNELRAARAHCGTALAAGLPVLQDYYEMLGRGTTGFKECRVDHHSGMVRVAGNLEAKRRPITTEARVSFYKAFGINPVRQMALESFYRGLNPSYSRRCERSFLDTFDETNLTGVNNPFANDE